MYSPPKIIDDFGLFIDHICEWIELQILQWPKLPKEPKKLFDKRQKYEEYEDEVERYRELRLPVLCGLTMDAILGSGLLPGVGRYTLEEVFFKAGLCTPLTPDLYAEFKQEYQFS